MNTIGTQDTVSRTKLHYVEETGSPKSKTNLEDS